MIEREEWSPATATFVSSGLASYPSHARLLFLISCCVPFMVLLGWCQRHCEQRSGSEHAKLKVASFQGFRGADGTGIELATCDVGGRGAASQSVLYSPITL